MKKEAIFGICILATTLPLLTGCGARVKSFPYDEISKNVKHGGSFTLGKEYKKLIAEGFIYYLPKTVLDVSGKCTLYRQFFYNKKTKELAAVLFTTSFDNGILVTPKGEIDPKVRFRIDPGPLRNWRVNTNKANFVMTDKGIISKVNAEFDDRTAEIIESTARTGINVAKMIAMGGADSNLYPGLIETVGTFDISSRIDPDDLNIGKAPEEVKKKTKEEKIAEAAEAEKPGKTVFVTAKLFENLLAKAQIEAHANLIKDELRDITPEIVSVVAYNLELKLSYNEKLLNAKGLDLNSRLGKNDFGSGVLRVISFENLAKNYVNGIATRIPAPVDIEISAVPEFSDQTTVIAKTIVASKDKLEEIDAAIEKLKNESIENNKIEIAVKEEEREKIYKEVRTYVDTQKLYKGTVPIAQLGRYGIIPVHSNTFVKQTKSLEVNTDTGMVSSYDHQASSSGERAAKMFENISKSAADEVPGIINAIQSGKKK